MDDPKNGVPDFDIIRAVQRGNREAYADLVRRHQQGVFRVCLTFLLNRAEAEDAAQETFFKAFVSLNRYKEDHSFHAWLQRIASNHCLDVLRKRSRQKTDSLDKLLDAGGDISSPIKSDNETALAVKALGEVPIDYRRILVLREIDGLSYDQIAEAMGCTLDAVKARLQRARQALQEKARHFFDDGTFNDQKDKESWTIKQS